jgi:nucleoside-diphosphate-sugar epimerase
MSALPVVVTGASGFLGQHLCKKLQAEGVEVIEVSRKTGYDVTNAESLKNIPPFSALFHLAAHTYVPDSYNKTALFFSTNINGTINALELCKKHKAHFLFAGSYIYGLPQELPINEKHPLSLWNPYATSKIIGEELCQSYCKEFDFAATSLRIFNIYGVGQNPTFLIPKIIEGIKSGKLELETATPKRDFVFVDDVANAFLLVFKSSLEGFNAFNVGYGKSYSVADVVEFTKQILKSNAAVSYNNTLRPTEVVDVIADCSKIKNVLGWEPKIDLPEGLNKMIESYF